MQRDKSGRFLKDNDEHKKWVSQTLKGKVGKDARCWKGESAGYVAKHLWIVKHYGSANKCENPNCKFENPKRYEWANISGVYHRERSDYMMLCPSCHRRMDKGAYCKRGHEFTQKNTIIRNGWRVCRTCNNNRAKEYYHKNIK